MRSLSDLIFKMLLNFTIFHSSTIKGFNLGGGKKSMNVFEAKGYFGMTSRLNSPRSLVQKRCGFGGRFRERNMHDILLSDTKNSFFPPPPPPTTEIHHCNDHKKGTIDRKKLTAKTWNWPNFWDGFDFNRTRKFIKKMLNEKNTKILKT